MSIATYTDNAQQFLKELRLATEVMHKRLESTQLSVALMKDDVSVTTYLTYLSYMRNVIAFCEFAVFPAVSHLFENIAERRKLQLIEEDIDMLEKIAGQQQIGSYKASIPENNIPFALGFMYVVEGSTLGGRMLVAHISNTLRYDEQDGARFFGGYGPLTGKKWKDFLQTLCNYVAEDNCSAEVIAGSKYAFETIEEYLASGR